MITKAKYRVGIPVKYGYSVVFDNMTKEDLDTFITLIPKIQVHNGENDNDGVTVDVSYIGNENIPQYAVTDDGKDF